MLRRKWRKGGRDEAIASRAPRAAGFARPLLPPKKSLLPLSLVRSRLFLHVIDRLNDDKDRARGREMESLQSSNMYEL